MMEHIKPNRSATDNTSESLSSKQKVKFISQFKFNSLKEIFAMYEYVRVYAATATWSITNETMTSYDSRHNTHTPATHTI